MSSPARIASFEVLSPEEAAKLLRVTARTLKEWRLAGEGPRYVRMTSRLIRYRPSDLAAWIDSKVSGDAAPLRSVTPFRDREE